ncbi:MAG: DNA polymerase/3'-5' exonuclease PolX [Elusimicrobiota bacterium]
MKNKEVAEILYQIAELLSLKNENPFKIRAYEKAAMNISSLTEDIKEAICRGEKISGVGESISEKIKEYLETGKLKYLDELKKDFPAGLLQIMSIPGMGPKKAKLIYDKLGVKTVDELKNAAQNGLLRNIKTLGEKTEENILKGIELIKQGKERLLISDALSIAERIIKKLKTEEADGRADIIQISEAGSLRRRAETIGDIDILCASKNPEKITERFCSFGKQILAKGETKSSILTDENIQVDLRIVKESEFGAALQYFTGSKQHNIALRELANKLGYKISEYGIFELETNKKVGGKTEEEIYKKLKLQFIPPELREAKGEIELAYKNQLPKLVKLADIKGDMHIHTNYSDGHMTIDQVVERAKQLGYDWLGICDHSQSLKVAGGLDTKTLLKKVEAIKKFNQNSKDIKLLCGSEVDILSDGTLDYSDDVLNELDIVVASIHTGFKQDEKTMTTRIIKAIKNKFVDIICHPTGRLIGEREPYSVNLEQVINAAAEYGVALEINAFPQRLDLQDIWCRKTKEKGIKLVIGTDAHFIDQLSFLKYGLFVARRGWLEKSDLLNCLNYSELKKILSQKR